MQTPASAIAVPLGEPAEVVEARIGGRGTWQEERGPQSSGRPVSGRCYHRAGRREQCGRGHVGDQSDRRVQSGVVSRDCTDVGERGTVGAAMRLASKIFLGFSLVIVVLAAVGVLSL